MYDFFFNHVSFHLVLRTCLVLFCHTPCLGLQHTRGVSSFFLLFVRMPLMIPCIRFSSRWMCPSPRRKARKNKCNGLKFYKNSIALHVFHGSTAPPLPPFSGPPKQSCGVVFFLCFRVIYYCIPLMMPVSKLFLCGWMCPDPQYRWRGARAEA